MNALFSVSHAGEKKEKKKLCRLEKEKKYSAWRVKMKKQNLLLRLRLVETVVVSFSFSFLLRETTKTEKVEKVLGES
jgi:hypothetical protein